MSLIFTVAVTLANFAAHTATSFLPSAIHQVAVSVANFATHTATSLFCHLPSGCVSCKLCSSHSHIIFPSSAIYQVAVSLANFAAHTATSFFHPQPSTKWLCQLQTLQLTQPHHFSTLSHLPGGCVSCKLCSSHSHIIFPSSVIYQVAVSLANFAAHTATSLFRHQPSTRWLSSTKWLCQLQTLQLTQPHHSFVLLPSGIYEMHHCAGYLKRYINITYYKSHVL